MAKLEISFPYKTLSTAAAAWYCLAWGVFGAWLVPNLVIILNFFSGSFDAVPKMLVQLLFIFSSAALYAYIPFRMVSTSLQGGTIAANQEGLGLPGTILGNAKFRPWTQLKLAEWHRGKILLQFGASDTVSIDTKQLERQNLEQLLLAVEVWGHKAVLANSLLEARDQIQNEKAGIEEHGYTKIWEEELNRRFNSTTFVPLEPGHKLRSNSLSILRQLAFGGFSAVYLAEDTDRNQVVIKESVTNIGDSSHEKALEFFKREALYLSGLHHPQVAKVLDDFIENGRNYLVLQYIAGENLREHVRKHGALAEKMVINLMAQMADVLVYLHEQNPPIIHRDFTPDNLVLKSDQTIVVIDFGAANEYVGTATGTLIGKQCYMPPEQVRGKSAPTTDLYALGCTAAFLLTAHDPEALSVCHPRAENPKVSQSTDRLIAELTQQDSKKRIQSAHILKSILQNPDQISKTMESTGTT
ncbi:hypothetical protein BH10CYA1_BH10CYA1_24060 [soil metagenome]